MNKSEKIAYWLEIAEYDLKTAKVMMDGKRYVYVGFMCHQTVEKVLKAYYTKIKNEPPPFTHNLLFLSEVCGLIDLMDDQKINFINILQPLNIEARYPSYKETIRQKVKKTEAVNLLNQTVIFLNG